MTSIASAGARFRAMNKAAETVYEAIRRDGHQKNVIDLMPVSYTHLTLPTNSRV